MVLAKQKKNQKNILSFHAIKGLRVSLASPEHILSWSYGEVMLAETLNYRTLKPERDGLFCEKIFGPTKNWTCSCGKFKRFKHKGRICDKCGVEIGPSYVRRIRMAHIELAIPVSHTWYTHGMPSPIAKLLDMTQRDLERVLSYTYYILLQLDEQERSTEIQRVKAEIARVEAQKDQPHMYKRSAQPAQKAQDTPSMHAVIEAPLLAAEKVLDVAIDDNSSSEDEQKDAAVLELEALLKSIFDSQAKSENIEDIEDKVEDDVAGDEEVVSEEESTDNIEVEEINEETTYPDSGESDPAILYLQQHPPTEEDLWEIEFDLISPQERLKQLQRVLTLLTSIRPMDLLAIDDYRLLEAESGAIFHAGIGAEAIGELLASLDLNVLAQTLRKEMQEKEGKIRSQIIRRLKIVEALRRSRTQPEWMIMTVIPVIPPDMRPVLQLNGGRFAASDINELYSRVIHRNNRLKRFIEIGAPDLILNREKASLQAACDSLFNNAHCSRPLIGANGKILRSLTDSITGKKGRFRHNLLGKRVDYSGRSVISVGLDLKVHQCGLPKKIALELFKPFIINKLIAYGIFETPRQAKRAIERKHPDVWDILDEVMQGRVVLLNRAPSLHRLSIQAFEPVLVEGNAIRLHPQVCSPFNADFDGDQMAVHLPLTDDAQREARELMLSTKNLLSPASGEPTISISQEQVLGCFYLTQEMPKKPGAGHIFADINEAILAYQHGFVDIHAPIIVRLPDQEIYDQPPPAFPQINSAGGRIQTTIGRLLFNEVLPKRLRYRNYAMTKDLLKQLVWECIKLYGSERTAIVTDAIKRLGFHHATRSGISFAISDVKVPVQKKDILAQADAKILELQEEWRSGLITREELHEQSIETWHKATDEVAQHVQNVLDPFGSLLTISKSGATKAKLQQIRQLSGMRGLMASPSGGIIETPVRGNFLEGLNMAEYFISSHGARKSLMDRSLNTAESGYLTIRFVNVAQDVIVTEEDCDTPESLCIKEDDSKRMGLPDSRSRLIGRVLAKPLPFAGLEAGDMLDDYAVDRIMTARIPEVHVRSVLTCKARRGGVCRQCYGWDLSKRALVQIGTAVGIIAAQSIGEPGTQLTMRTFHSGGIAGGQGDITQGIPRVEELFEARTPREAAPMSEIDGIASIANNEATGGFIITITTTQEMEERYPLPDDHILLAMEDSFIQAGQVIAMLPLAPAGSSPELRAGIAGIFTVDDDEEIAIIRAQRKTEKTYMLPPGRKPAVSEGQVVHAGDQLTAGALNLHDVLHYKGRAALQLYMLQEAQRVYRTTGAYIHDKHFEVIIRQMIRRVQIDEPGAVNLLPEDLIDSLALEDLNAQIIERGGQPATAHPVLLGLTRATLATESWLAAASFQQTSRMLTNAVLEGKTDHLLGIKENVILGKLIPAGTGLLPRQPRPRSKVLDIKRGRGRPRKTPWHDNYAISLGLDIPNT